jgi:hypothetical protein
LDIGPIRCEHPIIEAAPVLASSTEVVRSRSSLIVKIGGRASAMLMVIEGDEGPEIISFAHLPLGLK